jgi:hypothetical protein
MPHSARNERTWNSFYIWIVNSESTEIDETAGNRLQQNEQQ